MIAEQVAAAGDLAVHPGTAHLFEGALLADDHLGHPGRAITALRSAVDLEPGFEDAEDIATGSAAAAAAAAPSAAGWR